MPLEEGARGEILRGEVEGIVERGEFGSEEEIPEEESEELEPDPVLGVGGLGSVTTETGHGGGLGTVTAGFVEQEDGSGAEKGGESALLFLLELPLEEILGKEQLGVAGGIVDEPSQKGLGLVASLGDEEETHGPLGRRVLVGPLIRVEGFVGKSIAFKEASEPMEGAVTECLGFGLVDDGPGRDPA